MGTPLSAPWDHMVSRPDFLGAPLVPTHRAETMGLVLSPAADCVDAGRVGGQVSRCWKATRSRCDSPWEFDSPPPFAARAGAESRLISGAAGFDSRASNSPPPWRNRIARSVSTRRVAGSSPAGGAWSSWRNGERDPVLWGRVPVRVRAWIRIASSPIGTRAVARTNPGNTSISGFAQHDVVAERRGNGLQNRLHGFESRRRLQSSPPPHREEDK